MFIPTTFLITSGVITPCLVIDNFFFDRSIIVDSSPKCDFPESIINSIFLPKESKTCLALVEEI